MTAGLDRGRKMPSLRVRMRRMWSVAALGCAALILVVAMPSCDRSSKRDRQAALGTRIWTEELPVTRVLLLFYPLAGGGDLRAEPRRFSVERGMSALIKSALTELGRGPNDPSLICPFRHDLLVRGVYSQGDGTLFVDLGAGAQEVFGSGLSEEVAAISSIANTLFYNFPHVTRLKMLIDGEPVSSLGGHVDLSGFIYPEDWMSRSAVSLMRERS